MFRFNSPEYLHFLWALPVLIALYVLYHYRRRRQFSRLGDAERLAHITNRRSRIRPSLKFAFQLIAIALCVIALARPQMGISSGTERKRGIEAVIMMDVSNSMMADDVQPSRLERSKLLVSNLIDKMDDDRVALGVFAGEAYPQMPITHDYSSAKLFLDAINTGMVTLQGTNLTAAIELGAISFTEDKKAGKAIILITDGEDHVEGAKEAAQAVAKEGIKLFVVGVGSPKGSAIPLPDGGVLTDLNGNPVSSALNENLCREVAKAGGGIYFHLDNTSHAQEELLTALDGLQKSESSSVFTEYNEQFQALAFLAMLFLIIDVLTREAENPFFKRFNIFSRA